MQYFAKRIWADGFGKATSSLVLEIARWFLTYTTFYIPEFYTKQKFILNVICVTQVEEGGIKGMQELNVLQWERKLACDLR
jgi:hypothetical protein